MSARTANLLGAQAVMVVDRLRDAVDQDPSTAAALASLRTFAAGASIDELRRILGLSHSGGVRIVDRLVARGLLARTASGGDGRAVEIRLTTSGVALANEILAARREVLKRLLDPLDASERAALSGLLEKLLGGATTDRHDARRICRLCEPDVCGHPERCPVTQAERKR